MKKIDLLRGCNPLTPTIPESILSTPSFSYHQETDDQLINSLSKKYDVSNVFLFNGSVQAIQYILMHRYHEVIMLKNDFYVTENLAIENNQNITLIEREDLFLNLNKHTEEHTQNKKLYLIPYSSGYDGFTFSLEKIEMLLKNLIQHSPHSLFVLDGAYAEYSKIDLSYLKVLLKKYENFTYMGTFSKAYGLAGYRIGYLLGNHLESFNKQIIHFIIPKVCALVALYLLENHEFLEKSLQFNDTQKNYLIKQNKHLIATDSNRINYHNPSIDNALLHQFLLENEIMTRNIEYKSNKTISASIGQEDENKYFIEVLKKWEKNNNKKYYFE